MRAHLGARRAQRTTGCTVPLQKTLYGANVIIFEGIMAFADKALLEVRTGLKAHGLAGNVRPCSASCFSVVLTLNWPPASRPGRLLCPIGVVQSLCVGWGAAACRRAVQGHWVEQAHHSPRQSETPLGEAA